MAMSGLLVPLDCLDPRDRPELLDPEGGLETRELMDLLAHQEHRDPQARTVAMDPLALLDHPDSMETLVLRDSWVRLDLRAYRERQEHQVPGVSRGLLVV